MKRNPFVAFGLAVVMAGALSGMAYAATSIFINEADFSYKGHWIWNSSSASRVQVRVRNNDVEVNPDYDRIKIVVKGRAVDGTTVQGEKVGQILGGQTRDYTVNLSKPLSSLLFIQILEIPTNEND